MKEVDQYLKSTQIIDCDNGMIQEEAYQVTMGHNDVVEKARCLFHFVRDEIKYNPFLPRYLPEHFRDSNTLTTREGSAFKRQFFLSL